MTEAGTGAGCVLTWDAVNDVLPQDSSHVFRLTKMLDDAVNERLMEESKEAAAAATNGSIASEKKDALEKAVAPVANKPNAKVQAVIAKDLTTTTIAPSIGELADGDWVMA